jgi:hypothetical protein
MDERTERRTGRPDELGGDASAGVRLLPWPGEGGGPAYLKSDAGPGSALSRLADDMEAVQLGMAQELVGYAGRALANPRAPERELRHTIRCLIGSLKEVLRVAESRGERLSGAGGVR